MTTLTIKDLSVAAAELDSRAMSAVRGGTHSDYYMPVMPFQSFKASSLDANTQIQQYTNQNQTTSLPQGVDAAWLEGNHNKSNPYQNAYTNANVSISAH
jgi:hypothetical protein